MCHTIDTVTFSPLANERIEMLTDENGYIILIIYSFIHYIHMHQCSLLDEQNSNSESLLLHNTMRIIYND